ncbi:hypothetical protein PWP89_13140 [Stenotrophomonas rhizophila]|nr:hypothetical protein [Stenotrophomonas rhizophila]
MNAVAFFLGFFSGSIVAVAVAVVWHERCHIAHFRQLLDQVRSLGGRP